MKVKEESENDDFKFNIQKTKIMASGPITSRQIEGKDMQRAREIRGDGALGGKALTNLDSVLKSRDITLPTKSV